MITLGRSLLVATLCVASTSTAAAQDSYPLLDKPTPALAISLDGTPAPVVLLYAGTVADSVADEVTGADLSDYDCESARADWNGNAWTIWDGDGTALVTGAITRCPTEVHGDTVRIYGVVDAAPARAVDATWVGVAERGESIITEHFIVGVDPVTAGLYTIARGADATSPVTATRTGGELTLAVPAPDAPFGAVVQRSGGPIVFMRDADGGVHWWRLDMTEAVVMGTLAP